jgi:hypothetical protein
MFPIGNTVNIGYFFLRENKKKDLIYKDFRVYARRFVRTAGIFFEF